MKFLLQIQMTGIMFVIHKIQQKKLTFLNPTGQVMHQQV